MMNAQAPSRRTPVLTSRQPATGASARVTAFRVACLAVGIAAWLLLSFAAGAGPVESAGAARSDRDGEAPSTLLRRLKPATATPSRSALTPLGPARRASAKALDLADVYRFFNRATGVHFYTADAAERAHILATWPHFADEGAVWRALRTADAGTVPVWRFFNRDTGAHFYTTDATERQRILVTWPQFADEGAAFHAYLSDAFDRAPVHRFYNTQTRTHFYTAQDDERDYVQRTFPQFAYEGVPTMRSASLRVPARRRSATRSGSSTRRRSARRPRTSTARSRSAPPRGSTSSSRSRPPAIRRARSGTSRSTRATTARSARRMRRRPIDARSTSSR